MDLPRSFSKALSEHFGAALSAVAAGAGDATEVDGEDIDRSNAHSACFIIQAQAVLADTKTLVLKATLQDSPDGTTYTDVAADLQPEGAANSTVLTLTGESGGTTERGVYKLDVDLSSLDKYIRIQLLPELNATGTDTAVCSAVCLLGGLVIEP